MSLKTLFTDHPATVDETFGEHFVMASGFGWKMFIGAMACFVHAVFPFCCVKTGSGIITQLHGRMVTNRNTKQAPAAPQMAPTHAGDTLEAS